MFNRLILLCITTLIISCKSTINVTKPTEVYVPKTSYDKQTSIINIAVEIPIDELEKQTNKYLNGTIYEDGSFENNNGDNLKCIVKRYAPIKIIAYGNDIEITLPLDIAGSYAKLGAVLAYNGILSATYTTSITLLDDWKLKTVTHSKSHEWLQSPKVNVGMFNLPVKWIADAALRGGNNYINKSIDESIAKYINLKELTRPAFEALVKPINVSDEYKSWFKITPLEATITQLYASNNSIKFTMGLKAYTETFIGDKPSAKPIADLPMKVAASLPPDFNIGLVAVTPFKETTALLNQKLVASGYEYTEGKYHVKFTKLNVYGQNEKLVIELGLQGSITGNVYLIGTPYYDAETRTIKMKELDFDVDSKQKLLKVANKLAHGKLCNLMQQNMQFPIGNKLDEAKKEAQVYFSNYKPVKGITINGKLERLETSNLYLIQDAIVTLINVGGNLSVTLQGFE